jgi:regulator of replication initiation timing
MFIIRFAFYFTISFAILCIPVGGGQQLFDKLFNMVTPYASKAVNTTKQKFSSTRRYSKKLYSNSEPMQVEEDEVKSKMASVLKKKKVIKKENKPTEDTYTDEEQERLKRALSDE